MRSKEEHLRAIHRRVAQVAIGPSSLRNQGAPGVVDAARSYFEERIRLEAFAKALPLERTYQRRIAEGKHHMSTLNIIRNKLVSRVFAAINRQEPYLDLHKYAA
jgi:hypothetical protein